MFTKTSYGITVAKRRELSRSNGVFGYLLQEWLLFLTLTILIFKSIILMGFVYSSDQSVINMALGLKNIKYMSICIAPLAVLVSLSFLPKNKARLWFLLILNFLCSLLFFLDALYFRAGDNFLSFQLLGQSGSFGNMQGSILTMFRLCDLVFFFDIPVIAVLLIATRGLYYSSPLFTELKPRIISFFTVFVLAVVFMIFTHISICAGSNDKNAYIFYAYSNPKQTICNNAPVAYHFFDFYVFLSDLKP
ncbi:hypothetical protein LY28_01477 [Ruminiclostridium sufflavum DSM 19573]|uniref:Uncharacterized protein n=1 Tax=Ruminiclostridium sufflavum DSM 19573 TaxID=1121337 RepID=A0A318XN56_9FIRM|nr:hypothetical protein [Ruminiclostridium sufflavum]PYG88146.1 hypothetical protein LY28_01477 [Ruminiclostridium sufflavum DSM 19573]